jgi:hypothetical protein
MEPAVAMRPPVLKVPSSGDVARRCGLGICMLVGTGAAVVVSRSGSVRGGGYAAVFRGWYEILSISTAAAIPCSLERSTEVEKETLDADGKRSRTSK